MDADDCGFDASRTTICGNNVATENVNISPCKVRGVRKWRVRYWEGDKPKRLFFDRKDKAEAAAARLRFEISNRGAAWQKLSPSEASELMQLWGVAKKAGINLAEMLAESGKVKARIRKTASDALKELLALKISAGRAKAYTGNLKTVIGQFIKGREQAGIESFTTEDVERFMETKRLEYRPTLRSRLSTYFRFAVRKKYRHDNPCDALESVTLPPSVPETFTAMQTKRCLAWFLNHPRAMAWFILTTKCGLRPEEAQKSNWSKINFEEEWIRVEGRTSKVRTSRLVHPTRQAMAWLRLAKELGAELPLNHSLKKRTIKQLRKVLGFKKWPKDITRHTAASYWLAIKPDLAYVAEQMGTSERVLKRDYKVPITREMARRFWGMASMVWLRLSAALLR